MKRWMLRILICLILGAMTTIAVAWVPSQFTKEYRFRPMAWVDAPSSVLRIANEYRPEGFPEYDVRMIMQTTWSYDAFHTSTLGDEVRSPHITLGNEEKPLIWRIENRCSILIAGFPCRSMWSVVFARNSWESFEVVRTVGAFEGFPVRIQSIGFIINTLFYALIWFGVFFAPGMAKRVIRRKRGRCPRCGYDLRGHRGAVSGQPSAVSADALADSREPLAESPSVRCPECGWMRGRIEAPRHRGSEGIEP